VADVRIKPLECRPKASPDSADRHPKHGSNLAVGPALQVRQSDDAPLFVAELGHAAANRVPVKRRRQRLPFTGRPLAGSEITGKQLPGVTVVSEATARIDAKYVMAVGQPRPHGIEPALVARRRLNGRVHTLVLESPHATTNVIPTPSKRPNKRPPRAYTTPEPPA
jgi:hypothetical protein